METEEGHSRERDGKENGEKESENSRKSGTKTLK